MSKENMHLMSVENLPQVLKVKEVATILRISLSQAYELIARREIPCVRIGRIIRVPRTALEQYLRVEDDASHREASTKAPQTVRKAG